MVALTVVAAAGCMTAPVDGTVVASRDARVRFAGYMNETDSTVSVEASADGRSFREVTTAVSGGRAHSYWDTDWYEWSAYEPIPADLWTAGATGFHTYVRAQSGVQLFNTNQNLWKCVGQSGKLADFQRDCTEPVAILCTEDYLPNGSRRSLCPGRAVVARRTNGDERLHRLQETTDTISLVNPAVEIDYRGDNVSFIDVFDQHFNDAGTSAGGVNVVRFAYNADRTNHVMRRRLDPAVAADGASSIIPPGWLGARTIRQYDIGECSASVNWRGALDDIIAAVESRFRSIMVGRRRVELRPQSRAALRPVLRANGDDSVYFAEDFVLYADAGRLGSVRLGLDIRLGVDGGRLSATVDPKSTVEFEASLIAHLSAAFGGRTPEEIREQIRMRIDAAVPLAIAGILPTNAMFVEFERINIRADGLDVIFADDQLDPDFARASDTDMCDRTGPPVTDDAGILFTLFDPPSPRDHFPLGDGG